MCIFLRREFIILKGFSDFKQTYENIITKLLNLRRMERSLYMMPEKLVEERRII